MNLQYPQKVKRISVGTLVKGRSADVLELNEQQAQVGQLELKWSIRDGNYSLFILPASHFLSETAAQQRGAWAE